MSAAAEAVPEWGSCPVRQLSERLLQCSSTRRLLDVYLGAAACEKVPSLSAPVAVVPGAFYREYPQHRADGTGLLEAGTELGLQMHRIPLPSFCGVDEGARRIAAWFARWQGEPVVLVTMSKGAADAAAYFARAEEAKLRRAIKAWVSISGMLFGTPLIDVIARSPLRSLLLRAVFAWKGYRYRDLRSLSRPAAETGAGPGRESAARAGAIARPPFPSYHLLGFPSEAELSTPLARRSVRRLAAYGPSDGGGLLLEQADKYPGVVLPLAGHDHYLRKFSERQMLCGMAAVLRADGAVV